MSAGKGDLRMDDFMIRRPLSATPSSASTEESQDDDIKKGAWTAEEDVQLEKSVKVSCEAVCFVRVLVD